MNQYLKTNIKTVWILSNLEFPSLDMTEIQLGNYSICSTKLTALRLIFDNIINFTSSFM